MKKLYSSVFLLSLCGGIFCTSAYAVSLSNETSKKTLTVEEAAALSGVILEDSKPTQMTAEEKFKVQQPLRESINYLSENYRKNELDMVVDAMKTLEKNKLRRLNRNLRPSERIKVKDVNVNTKQPDEVRDFLNAKITNTLQQSMPQESSEPTTTN